MHRSADLQTIQKLCSIAPASNLRRVTRVTGSSLARPRTIRRGLYFQLRRSHDSQLSSAGLDNNNSQAAPLAPLVSNRFVYVKHHYALELVRIFSKLHNFIDNMSNRFLCLMLCRAENTP